MTEMSGFNVSSCCDPKHEENHFSKIMHSISIAQPFCKENIFRQCNVWHNIWRMETEWKWRDFEFHPDWRQMLGVTEMDHFLIVSQPHLCSILWHDFLLLLNKAYIRNLRRYSRFLSTWSGSLIFRLTWKDQKFPVCKLILYCKYSCQFKWISNKMFISEPHFSLNVHVRQ